MTGDRVASTGIALGIALLFATFLLGRGPGTLVWLTGKPLVWLPFAGSGLSWLPFEPGSGKPPASPVAAVVPTSTPTPEPTATPTPTPTPTPIRTPTPVATPRPTPPPTPAPTPPPTPAPTPTPALFADNFETDTLGSTSPRGMYVQSGTWTVAADGSQVLTNTNAGIITTPGSTWTDYTLTASVKTAGAGYAKVIARYQNTSNFYVCGIEGNSNVFLGKMYGGTWYGFGDPSYSYSSSTWYTISFTVKGSALTCTVTDPATGRSQTATANVSYFAGGPAGLISAGGAEYDNLVVKSSV